MTPRDLLTEYDQQYQRVFGARAPLTGAKDGKLASELLKLYTDDQLRRWIPAFFAIRDTFIENSGYTFGVFKACLGKVIAHEARRAKLSKMRICPYCGEGCARPWCGRCERVLPTEEELSFAAKVRERMREREA